MIMMSVTQRTGAGFRARGVHQRLLLGGMCVLVIGLSVSNADADRLVKSDGNGSPGRLDIASVSHAHRPGKLNRLVHTLTTYERWNAKLLRHRKNWIAFFFDSADSDPPGNRFLWIRYSTRKERLIANLYRSGGYLDEAFIARVNVWRPNRRSVRVVVPEGWLHKGKMERYFWSAETSYEKKGTENCPQSPQTGSSIQYGSCLDTAPNGERSIRHRL